MKNAQVIASVLVIFVALVLLVACVKDGNIRSSPKDFGRTQQREDTPEYTVFYIEGMPCVWIELDTTRNSMGYGHGGLTCDWSRWNGE